MNEILDFYQQQAAASLSTIPWLAKLQSNASTELNRCGFPGRHDEEWKYTSVDALLKQPFSSYNQELTVDIPKASDLPIKQRLYLLVFWYCPCLRQLQSIHNC